VSTANRVQVLQLGGSLIEPSVAHAFLRVVSEDDGGDSNAMRVNAVQVTTRQACRSLCSNDPRNAHL
jgi:hypothetical protein